MARKILFIGELSYSGIACHRMRVLQEKGYIVRAIDSSHILKNYFDKALDRIGFRLDILSFQKKIKEIYSEFRPEVVWVDKGIFISKKLVDYFNGSGAYTVHYNLDNPFGDRDEYYWWRYKQAIQSYTLNVMPRISNEFDLKLYGAKEVLIIPWAYDKSVHFPPQSQVEKQIDVGFVGTCFENRDVFFEELADLLPEINIFISGNNWDKLKSKNISNIRFTPPKYNKDYRDIVWKTKISIGLLSKKNKDDMTTRSVEIPAMGGFLLMQYSEIQHEIFYHGDRKGAELFRSIEECAHQIKYYLEHDELRNQIARVGQEIIMDSNYEIGSVVQVILDHVYNIG